MAAVSQQLKQLLATLLLVCIVKVELVLGEAYSDWEVGRSTFYGAANDPWKLSMGHCQYGYLSKTKCTGWDVAAIADKNKDYNAGDSNCGRCYEVMCDDGWITDGYGESFDRNICFHKNGASVVVMIVDLCECNYAPNYYSNKRWCCGDYQHFDLSVKAFAKLMPVDKGVGRIKFRRVSCDHKPATEAWYPGNNEPADGESPPWNWNGDDGRSCPSSTRRAASRRPVRRPARKPVTKKSSGGSNVSLGRWSINSWSGRGINGRTATACGTLLPWGGFSFNNLRGKRNLDVWVKKEQGNLPNMVVKASGGGGCRPRHIRNLPRTGTNGEYIRVRVGLNSFKCGGVHKVLMQNNIGNWGWQNACIDLPRAS